MANDALTATTVASRYSVTGRLGDEGSSVFRAVDRDTGSTVALKLIDPARASSPGQIEQFFAAARLACAMGGPGSVRVIDVGVSGRLAYQALELVEGTTLGREIAERGRLRPREALELVARACVPLGEMHRRGFVHRNVTPSHLLVAPGGEVRLLLSSLAELEASADPGGSVLGTPRYLSPEQAAGQPATPASDVYSLGAVLYEALAGVAPFESASEADLVLAHLSSTPPPLPGLPEAVQRIVGSTLSKSPSDRPSSDELARACERAIASLGDQTPDLGSTIEAVDRLGELLSLSRVDAGGELDRRSRPSLARDMIALFLSLDLGPCEPMGRDEADALSAGSDLVFDRSLPELGALLWAHAASERSRPGTLERLVESGHVHAVVRRLLSLRDGLVEGLLRQGRDRSLTQLAEALFALERPTTFGQIPGKGIPTPGGFVQITTGGPTTLRLSSGATVRQAMHTGQEPGPFSRSQVVLPDGTTVTLSSAPGAPPLPLARAAVALLSLAKWPDEGSTLGLPGEIEIALSRSGEGWELARR